mmetsp:Transcript_4333/g.12454  ORF Transcript_4333/g.12454 Transcript_4333/m.12454 type:complete len:153 (-) Transcript_4333:138-596(-)
MIEQRSERMFNLLFIHCHISVNRVCVRACVYVLSGAKNTLHRLVGRRDETKLSNAPEPRRTVSLSIVSAGRSGPVTAMHLASRGNSEQHRCPYCTANGISSGSSRSGLDRIGSDWIGSEQRSVPESERVPSLLCFVAWALLHLPIGNQDLAE